VGKSFGNRLLKRSRLTLEDNITNVRKEMGCKKGDNYSVSSYNVKIVSKRTNTKKQHRSVF
jgi:hypothetical protein